MLCDEAPAALRLVELAAPKSARRTSAGAISKSGPTSLVAAEIHLGRSSETADPYLSIQIACHLGDAELSSEFNYLRMDLELKRLALRSNLGSQPKN
jgi:hypothetical protein